MSFQQIIGHYGAKKILLGAVSHKRLGGTYLFAGPDGTGKRLAALSLARLMNCPAPKEAPLDACGECRSCRKISDGIHPDVMLVRPEKTTLKIEQIREVLKVMALQPYEGRHRFVIVEDADSMNEAAANAFLKTLEEPPANSHIILLTTRPSALLPTILSRCQTVNFYPLSPKEVREVLAGRGIEEDRIDMLTALSGGSPGCAMSIAEGEAEKSRGEALSLLSRIPGGDATEIISCAELLAKEPAESLVNMLRWLYSFLRDLAVFEHTKDKSFVANPDLWYDISRHGERFHGPYLIRSIGLVGEAMEALRRNANRQLALEVLFFKMNGREAHPG